MCRVRQKPGSIVFFQFGWVFLLGARWWRPLSWGPVRNEAPCDRQRGTRWQPPSPTPAVSHPLSFTNAHGQRKTHCSFTLWLSWGWGGGEHTTHVIYESPRVVRGTVGKKSDRQEVMAVTTHGEQAKRGRASGARPGPESYITSGGIDLLLYNMMGKSLLVVIAFIWMTQEGSLP